MARWTTHRKDNTEDGIREALEAVGALVLKLDPFDALVYFRGRLYMLDAKTKGTGHGKTKTQQRLVDQGWPLQFPESPQEALDAIGCRVKT